MTALIAGIFGAIGFSVFIFVMSLAREKGTLEERLRKLEEQAAIDKKRADIMAKPRTDDETINSLDDGSF